MQTYQTTLYNAVFTNEQFGWDYGTMIFQSQEYENPSDAMKEFNDQIIKVDYWIATMKVIENNDVLEEEIFDSTVLRES